MSYKKALELLEAYEPKRLIPSRYFLDGACCVFGAIAPSTRKIVGGLGIASALWRHEDVSAEVASLGMNDDEAFDLQRENDRVGTDADRYARVIAWLRARVAEENGGAK